MFPTSASALFRLGVALIALHVLDDNYIHPQPGMSLWDHVLSGLLPLALLGAAAWGYPRLRGAARGALAMTLGVLGILGGVEAIYYTDKVGASGDDFTGLLSVPAGLLLIGLGAVTLWRTRRTEGNHVWRYTRRGLLLAATYVVAMVVMLPVGMAYVVTHTARAVVPADQLGVEHENVSFTTSDGLELKGWYIPSRNGAAVISFPGRNGPQKSARMLARHGYGVLLFDRRGEGESEGEPNIFGWGGDRDVKAAIDYLQTRSDVDPERIGGIGFSVGGEMMLEAAAETDELKAVVSEGAGARALAEDLDEDRPGGLDGLLIAAGSAVRTASLAVLTNEPVPAHLETLVDDIAPRPVMFIAAPNSANGEELNRRYHAAAHEPKELWEIPESKHIGGQDARPAEYERRVIGFFDRALRP